MKIRTQLVLACFILSVLPLTGIVLYSYQSSRRAVEAAYHQEAQRLTRQMDRRLASIRAELDERLAALADIPLQGLPPAGSASRAGVMENILTGLGPAAPLIDALTVIPHPRHASAPEPPEPPEPAEVAGVEAQAEDAEEQAEAQERAEERRLAATSEPIVIDLPPIVVPRFEMSPQWHASMSEIARLSAELAKDATKMSREEVDARKKVIRERQEVLEQEMETTRENFHREMRAAQRQREERRRRQEAQQRAQAARATRAASSTKESSTVTASGPASAAAPAAATPPRTQRRVVRTRRELSPEEKQRLERRDKQGSLILGRSIDVPIQKEGEVVGAIRAQLRTEEVVRRVLGGSGGDDRDEVPFAIDREGNVYTRGPAERATLDRLGIPERVKAGRSLREIQDWIVVMTRDEESGLRVGVARPVGQNLVELRQTAARNFGYGLGLIAFALIGIVPLANHFTRDVKRVTEGAERIAQGDLQTRLPVKSKDEFGQLALAFNRMAEDLSEHQRRLFEEERARREQEVQQRVLSLEYERKTEELEEARRFQLSMLPKALPKHDGCEVAVFTETATEVGGDYYDFHLSEDGLLSVTIGDATGHGARAGTMVTVIKTLFAGYQRSVSPSAFLGDAAEKIKRMELGRMAMALLVARFNGEGMSVASAGMPPVLLHRAEEGTVEEIALPATPLGTIGMVYEDRQIPLRKGDTVLFMTDGFPELQNDVGQQVGYHQAAQEFSEAALAPTAQGVIDSLATAVRRWRGEGRPNDDITFVAVRIR